MYINYIHIHIYIYIYICSSVQQCLLSRRRLWGLFPTTAKERKRKRKRKGKETGLQRKPVKMHGSYRARGRAQVVKPLPS
jgi:hypothetical protein